MSSLAVEEPRGGSRRRRGELSLDGGRVAGGVGALFLKRVSRVMDGGVEVEDAPEVRGSGRGAEWEEVSRRDDGER